VRHCAVNREGAAAAAASLAPGDCIAQDYLEAFAGLNLFLGELQRIPMASRKSAWPTGTSGRRKRVHDDPMIGQQVETTPLSG